MTERKPHRNQKYDEMEETVSGRTLQIGRKRPVYLEYDANGRRKDQKEETFRKGKHMAAKQDPEREKVALK